MRKDKHDEHLHALIRAAYRGKRLDIQIDPLRLNRADSPVYNMWDNLLPLLLLMGLGMAALLLGGLFAGMAAMMVVVFIQVFGLRLLIGHQLRGRTVEAVLRNAHNLNVLWAFGGIALLRKGPPEDTCVAPAGDWRRFVRRYFVDNAAPGMGNGDIEAMLTPPASEEPQNHAEPHSATHS